MPFETINGVFEAPPFHIHCRSIVVPWMPGMINDERAIANAELQRRPKKDRDARGFGGMPGPEGGPSGPLSPTGPDTGGSYVPKASGREVAEDLVDTLRKAGAIDVDEFMSQSPMHANFTYGVRSWTGGQNQIDRLREATSGPYLAHRDAMVTVMSDALPTETTLYRGMGVADREMRDAVAALKPGDVMSTRLASSFTSNESWAGRFRGPGMDPESVEEYGIDTGGLPLLDWDGVLLRMDGGRAVPIEKISNTPKEQEWLVGRDLRVVSIEQEGFEAWVIDVETV